MSCHCNKCTHSFAGCIVSPQQSCSQPCSQPCPQPCTQQYQAQGYNSGSNSYPNQCNCGKCNIGTPNYGNNNTNCGNCGNCNNCTTNHSNRCGKCGQSHCQCSNSTTKCNTCGHNECQCASSGKNQKSQNNQKNKRCNKCYRKNCDCVEYFPYLSVKCGCVAATLTKTANPTTYSAIGQTILYTYTITNIGTAPICYPVQICDNILGGQTVFANIPPGSAQEFSRNYTISILDVAQASITNTAVAYIQVKCNKSVCTPPASATITQLAADLTGTISQTPGGTSPVPTAIVTVSITNNGPSSAQNVNLILNPTVSPGSIAAVTPVSITLPDTLNITGTTVTFSTPGIAPGATRTFQFSYQRLGGPGTVTWSGTITSTTFDPIPANNFLTSTIIL